ncbi:hypothetical protein B0A49_13905, partial [Cryomyces minteri]
VLQATLIQQERTALSTHSIEETHDSEIALTDSPRVDALEKKQQPTISQTTLATTDEK